LRADDGSEVARWPDLGSRRSRAVVRDVDADGRMDVFSATRTQGIVRIDGDGQVQWRYGFVDEDDRQPSSSGPATIADIDGDGEYEVLAGFEDGSVRVVAARTGAPVWVFHTGGGDVEGRPVVADVDGDGMAEIFVAGHDRNVYCLRHAPARPDRGR
jgi:outer membrane protein assembly factor BamB